jgi:hypothetical protein
MWGTQINIGNPLLWESPHPGVFQPPITLSGRRIDKISSEYNNRFSETTISSTDCRSDTLNMPGIIHILQRSNRSFLKRHAAGCAGATEQYIRIAITPLIKLFQRAFPRPWFQQRVLIPSMLRAGLMASQTS